MTFLFDGRDDVRSFVEWRTIQDDHRLCRCTGEERVFHPRKEDGGVDIAIPQFHSEQFKGEYRADGVQPSFRMPISSVKAPHSSRGVAMRAWSIHGEAALIKVHNGTFFDVLVPPYSRLKLYALYRISFGMKQSFFYS